MSAEVDQAAQLSSRRQAGGNTNRDRLRSGNAIRARCHRVREGSSSLRRRIRAPSPLIVHADSIEMARAFVSEWH